jgi:hypothetical protein
MNVAFYLSIYGSTTLYWALGTFSKEKENSYVINTRMNGPRNHSKEEKRKIPSPLQTTEPQMYMSEPIMLQTNHYYYGSTAFLLGLGFFFYFLDPMHSL